MIGLSAKKVEWPARRAVVRTDKIDFGVGSGGGDHNGQPIQRFCQTVRRSTAADVEWPVGRKFRTTAVAAAAAKAAKAKAINFDG